MSSEKIKQHQRKLDTIQDIVLKQLTLFILGGFLYIGVELIYRHHSALSMFFLGGLCFILIGLLNEKYPWEMPLISQMFISMCIVTALEFIFGIILNIVMGLGIWDYQFMPYNLLGQICLLFSVAWFFLSLPAIIVDDLFRWWFFEEEIPHYTLFYTKIPKR